MWIFLFISIKFLCITNGLWHTYVWIGNVINCASLHPVFTRQRNHGTKSNLFEIEFITSTWSWPIHNKQNCSRTHFEKLYVLCLFSIFTYMFLCIRYVYAHKDISHIRFRLAVNGSDVIYIPATISIYG